MLSVKCTVCESLQLYSPTAASDGAAIPATVGDCLELRSQLTTDAYTLTLPVNSREATLVLSQLCSSIRLSFSPSRKKEEEEEDKEEEEEEEEELFRSTLFSMEKTPSVENNRMHCELGSF